MTKEERLAAILELLVSSGRIQVDEITERLDISPATARRDLDLLAKQQLLIRTRGGATAHSVAYDLPIRYKSNQHHEKKVAIAAAASALVPRGAVIGLSGGTTTTAIAERLMARADIMEQADDPGLTVVTNAVNIAMQLSLRSQIKTVVSGGVVHPRSYELVGRLADTTLEALSLDIAFIGANGFDLGVGASTHDEREAAVNATMARQAASRVLVVDSSKLGKRSFAAIGSDSFFDTVITDDGISSDLRDRIRERGRHLIVADSSSLDADSGSADGHG